MFGRSEWVEAPWSAEQESAEDFRRARLGAFYNRLARRLKSRLAGERSCCGNCCDSLACFPDRVGDLRRRPGTKKEFETVETSKITGSVGRCRAFDGDFAPACSCTRARWERIARAFRKGSPLPPVELYKVSGEYFVYDGNHRVSVARYHRAVALDALVTEFSAP